MDLFKVAFELIKSDETMDSLTGTLMICLCIIILPLLLLASILKFILKKLEAHNGNA